MSELHEAPVEEQQAAPVAEVDDDMSLEDSLSAEFDRQDNDDDPVEIEATDDHHEEPQEEQEPIVEEPVEYNEAAPERWPDELKTAYAELPASGKKAMLEGVYKPMQRSFTQKTQEMAATRKQLDPLLSIVNKHADSFQRAGIDPAAALERQMEWSAHFAKVGNDQGAKDLAAAYAGTGGQQDEAYLTPIERKQQAELNDVKAQLQNVQNIDQQRTQQAQRNQHNQQQAQVQGSIQAFATEMRDGNLAHPHMSQVSTDMAKLINGGVVNSANEYGQPLSYSDRLESAYTMACRLHPSIPAVGNPSNAEQVRRVAAASREVVSKSPGGRPDVEPGKLSDDLSDLYDRLNR